MKSLLLLENWAFLVHSTFKSIYFGRLWDVIHKTRPWLFFLFSFIFNSSLLNTVLRYKALTFLSLKACGLASS